jgi:hypothetical protein
LTGGPAAPLPPVEADAVVVDEHESARLAEALAWSVRDDDTDEDIALLDLRRHRWWHLP